MIERKIFWANKIPVEPEAIEIAERLVKTGISCRMNKDKIPQEGEITLLSFQQIFPILGICLIEWASANQLEKIRDEDVLRAMASDFHYQMTRENIQNYIPLYGLTTPEKISKFYLFDLVVGGQLGLDEEANEVLFYPSREDPLMRFCLKSSRFQKKEMGDYAVIHLGQVIKSLGRNDVLVKELQKVHQSQREVGKLFIQNKGELINVFEPVSGQRK